MSIPDKWFEKASEGGITTTYLTNRNLTGISLKHNNISSLLFLSLTGNQIKTITFLNSFPNIWYIDLKNNPIEDFDVLNKKNNLGYVGVTLNRFSEQNFFQLKKLNIGILQLDGEIDDTSKYNNFIYNSSNNFLKVNNKVILFSDKFKIFSLSTNEILAMFSQNKTRSFQQKSSTLTMFRRTSNQIIRVDTIQNELSDLEDVKAFFTLFRNSMVKVIEGLVSQSKMKLFSNHETFDIPEYLNLEKTKLRTLFNVYQDILKLNKYDNKIIASCKNEKLKFIDFSVLKINVESVQCIILCAILLYIVSILSLNLTEKILISLLKKYKDDATLFTNIQAILRVEKTILLCCYYELLEYYRDDENFITENNLHTLRCKLNSVKKSYYLNKLDIDNLVSNVNQLQNRENEILHIYDKNSSFGYRRGVISLVLINFLEKELNIMNNVLSLTQQIFDYIILNNLENDILSNDYKVFLEIRNCLLDKYERNNLRSPEAYNPYSDRMYNDYKWKQLGREFNITLNNSKKPKVVNQGDRNTSVKELVSDYNLSTKPLPIKLKISKIKPMISSYKSQLVLSKPTKLYKSTEIEVQTDSPSYMRRMTTDVSFHPLSRNQLSSTTMTKNTLLNTSVFMNTETTEENRFRATFKTNELTKSLIRVNTVEEGSGTNNGTVLSSGTCSCKCFENAKIEITKSTQIPVNYTRLLKKLKVISVLI
jgi:hypothetical protein